MSDILGIGIIGAGRMGKIHTETLRKIANVKIIAIADLFPEKARHFAQKYELVAYNDYRSMLDRDDIDAVIICLPHTLHYDCVVASANAGKHILCEKPIETTINKMDSMLRECEKNKIIFMPGHTHRFLPANVKVKQMIDIGDIGKPIMAHDKIIMRGFESGYPEWMGIASLAGGGIFMNNGVHSVDRMRFWLNGEIESVFAKCGLYAMNIETEDNGMLFLTFSNGTYSTSELSWSIPKPADICIAEIIGTEGIIEVMTWKFIRIINRHDTDWRDIPIPEGNGFLNELTEFIQAIRENRTPSVTPHDGRIAVSAILAAYESSRTGQPVKPN